MRNLAIDLGGTNLRLAVFQDGVQVWRAQRPATGPSLLASLRPNLPAFGSLDAACVALAGPVSGDPISGDTAQLTNHPWCLSRDSISSFLGCPVLLVNDFVAAARGVPELSPHDTYLLHGPEPMPGALSVVLGAGTGLGQALTYPGPQGLHVQPTEGGHADFAPNTQTQAALWSWLHARHDHVSMERVLSGPGLLALQHFFCERGLSGPLLETPAQVSAGSSDSAQAAVACFCSVLGAHAGNLALSLLPQGGVWLAGGIPPRLNLVEGGLLRAFLNKGRLSDMLDQVPLLLISDPDLGLRGAAALAAEHAAH